MKRFFILVIMIFAAVFCGITALAEESGGVELGVGSVCVRSGETFLVPVYAEVHEGFASFIIDMEYDNTVLTPISIRRGSALSGILMDNISYRENMVRVVYSMAENNNQSGILFYVEFKAGSQTDVISELKLLVDFLSNESYDDVSHTETGGNVNISVNSWMPFGLALEVKPGHTEVEVSNLSYESAKGILYLALYDDDGRMISVHSKEVSADSFEHNLKYTWNIPGAESIKAFMLAEDMRPYSYFIKK